MILCVEEASCRFQYFFLFVTNLTDPFCKAIQPSGTDPSPPPHPSFGKEELPGVFTLVAGVLLRSSLEQPEEKKKKKKRIKMTTKMFDQCVVSVYSCTVLPTLRRRSNMCVSPSCSSSAPPSPLSPEFAVYLKKESA